MVTSVIIVQDDSNGYLSYHDASVSMVTSVTMVPASSILFTLYILYMLPVVIVLEAMFFAIWKFNMVIGTFF